ncbi:MAG: hypothetical protein NE328_21665 [Lentisphaeraceae bacterium]|nr:hypothetical protein [Lentisphaeraceae bacterium]
MDLCEKIKEYVNYLQENGFEEKYLSDVHQLNKQTYKGLFAYLETKKFQDADNTLLAEKLEFVVEELKKDSEISSFRLVHEVFKKWPPENS